MESDDDDNRQFPEGGEALELDGDYGSEEEEDLEEEEEEEQIPQRNKPTQQQQPTRAVP